MATASTHPLIEPKVGHDRPSAIGRVQLVDVSEPPFVCPADILIAGVDIVEAQVSKDGGPSEYGEHATIRREGDGAELELLFRG